MEDCTTVLVCMVRKAATEVFRGGRGRDEPGGQRDNESQRAGNDSNRERKGSARRGNPETRPLEHRGLALKDAYLGNHRSWLPGVRAHNSISSSSDGQFLLHCHFC